MRQPAPMSAGILIAIGAIAGFAFGLLRGETNWWTFVGTIAGAAAALLVYLVDRTRRRG
ncbi:hypothetical protein [Sphingomonas ginkgonis]|uniref:hypothetical protein n=1 Tax=Sphingomonas ginkgonis TaxID=2315330 RepID=UPI001639880C|nr:hypothetical protein [Sphingomonas ginkgonis]